MEDKNGTVRYYIVAGLIIDGFPTIKNSTAMTLVYDDAATLEEEWPDAHYIELVGEEIEKLQA